MARPIWQGNISFGLINIGVSLFPGENRSELHFHMVDSRNNARVRFERINEVTGEEVPWKTVVKGYEYDDAHHFILLKDEDFKKADRAAAETISIAQVVIRTRQYVAALLPRGDALVLNLLRKSMKPERAGKSKKAAAAAR